MTQYFFLQLFVIGFNKAFNERKIKDTFSENLDFLKVFIISFCVFFYLTITFSFFSSEYINYGGYRKKEEEKKEEEKNEEKKNEEEKNKEKKEEEKKEEEKNEEEKNEEEKNEEEKNEE